jgi:nucleoid-associated protein YgaU
MAAKKPAKKTNLKSILKLLKLNESAISMILGVIVIVVVGVLVVNFFRGRSTGQLLPAGNQTEKTETLPETYTVKSGDNLWKIAQSVYGSGYNWVDIASANKLANPSQIEIGQELTLPNVQAKTATVKVTATNNANSSNLTNNASQQSISGATYTVVKGDNLWTIAVRAYGDGYKWPEIAKENKLAHPGLIHPGNILTLPR